jgi:hypothetical protein
VIIVEQTDLDIISKIAARYGYVEWTLIGFTQETDYNIVSYFTDPSVLPVFKYVLLSILKTLDEYLERTQRPHERQLHCAGSC